MVAGTSVPDWLSVVNRKVRARSIGARPLLEDNDWRIRDVAAGIIQHHDDDRWFHGSLAFTELNLAFAVELRDLMPDDEGFRPSFLGHILVEILIDADLIAEDRRRADQFYESLKVASPELIEAVVNRVATVQTDRLAMLVPHFIKERFLYDYLEDDTLLFRLNQVMRRVGLPMLPEAVKPWLKSARERVSARRDELLSAVG